MPGQRPKTAVVVVLVTCPSQGVARRLGTELIQRRLAACVNLLPRIESLFIWKGKMERCPECLLVIKTTQRRFEQLRRAVLALHPYDVPELIALPVTLGSRPYLQWVVSSTTSS